MYISVAEIHNRFSRWLKKAQEEPVTITSRGKPVGIIISPEEYEQLRRVRAYLQMLRLSESFGQRGDGLRANDLFQASRRELEEQL